MQNFDLHVHSTFSDGENTPEEIVLEAIDRGLDKIGISDHSYVKGAEEWCMEKDAMPVYLHTVKSLQKKYAGQIEILCGLEQDSLSEKPNPEWGLDFIIESVHFLKIDNNLIAIDENPDILTDAADRWFDGDIYRLCEKYYTEVKSQIKYSCPTIIGHVDLIAKFNENNKLFDENNPQYRKAYSKAILKLLEIPRPFEINYGAVIRGYRSKPYPSDDIEQYIAENGGTFILSSDSHSKSTIGYRFSEVQPYSLLPKINNELFI